MLIANIPLQSLTLYFFLSLTFRALSVILYLTFMFIVVVVLLNVLIAQVSDTYSKVLSTAEGVYLYHRCRYIANVNKQSDRINYCLSTSINSINITEDTGIVGFLLQTLCLFACVGITSFDLLIAYSLAVCYERQVS